MSFITLEVSLFISLELALSDVTFPLLSLFITIRESYVIFSVFLYIASLADFTAILFALLSHILFIVGSTLLITIFRKKEITRKNIKKRQMIF